MNDDTEIVSVWSLDPPMEIATGVLSISEFGLPRVKVTPINKTAISWGRFHPWTFPASWQLRPIKGQSAELIHAWFTIQQVMSDLAIWHERHDSCGKEEQQGDILQWDGNATSTSGQCPGTLLELNEEVGP